VPINEPIQNVMEIAATTNKALGVEENGKLVGRITKSGILDRLSGTTVHDE
jgi:glycine betaine/proline transport system ATP-binding protein